MRAYATARRGASAALCFLAAGILGWDQVRSDTQRAEKSERARIVLTQELPKMDGEHLKATLVEVSYGPGEASAAHSHPCPVIGYVAAGALRTQVRGEKEVVYTAGESFYEAPQGVHVVSANASQTEPAKLIAYFVCDHDAPLSLAAPGSAGRGGK
ncbi:MAG TPA: cupin domain-containing protein [Candidatus Acidoferrales bacterium]|nr:cupin domain-containing protein [Candidatus Acidoferrales bacterium]